MIFYSYGLGITFSLEKNLVVVVMIDIHLDTVGSVIYGGVFSTQCTEVVIMSGIIWEVITGDGGIIIFGFNLEYDDIASGGTVSTGSA